MLRDMSASPRKEARALHYPYIDEIGNAVDRITMAQEMGGGHDEREADN